ncbi:sialidase family protein [Alkalicoccobacillus porphyridii]|uniref:Glycosyl hydrolase n=1 Tax=Alkalicoccobacillus porphyridii TaxID=2597270 RepID=A0A554A0Y4_9BACI|nr:sialidase family protein [Alkalicoccobacillus porphyridii]TSB47306.1 glycosyl hydrolase [Alkalicoccobacillus porphyridii]
MQLNYVSTNKIPSPFSHNHASNLLQLQNGDLLCTWFGGTKEGKADVSILCSRLAKGEQKWSEPIIFKGNSERSEQNPILFEAPDQQIWLMYTAQYDIHQDTAIVYIRKSADNGQTWGDASVLFDKPGSFVRNPPVVLEDGAILLPAYYSMKASNGFLGDDYSVVKISRDQGRTWDEYEVPESKGLVHMSIVSGSNGLIGFFRSRKADAIYRTTCSDDGKTWTKPAKIELPNNNASIQAISSKKGSILVIYNHINAEQAPPKENRPPWFDKADIDGLNLKTLESATWGVVRSPLKIAESTDEGKSWNELAVVASEKDVSSDYSAPEFSYPSILEGHDNLLHVSFTFLREHIQHSTYKLL